MAVRLLACLALAILFVGCEAVTQTADTPIPTEVPLITKSPMTEAPTAPSYNAYFECLMDTQNQIYSLTRDRAGGAKIVWATATPGGPTPAPEDVSINLSDITAEVQWAYIADFCRPFVPDHPYADFNQDCLAITSKLFLELYRSRVAAGGDEWARNPLAGIFILEACKVGQAR